MGVFSSVLRGYLGEQIRKVSSFMKPIFVIQNKTRLTKRILQFVGPEYQGVGVKIELCKVEFERLSLRILKVTLKMFGRT